MRVFFCVSCSLLAWQVGGGDDKGRRVVTFFFRFPSTYPVISSFIAYSLEGLRQGMARWEDDGACPPYKYLGGSQKKLLSLPFFFDSSIFAYLVLLPFFPLPPFSFCFFFPSFSFLFHGKLLHKVRGLTYYSHVPEADEKVAARQGISKHHKATIRLSKHGSGRIVHIRKRAEPRRVECAVINKRVLTNKKKKKNCGIVHMGNECGEKKKKQKENGGRGKKGRRTR